MEVLFILIPIALLFVALGLWLFFWAVDNGQFDDLDSPAHRILFDDDRPEKQNSDPEKSVTPAKDNANE